MFCPSCGAQNKDDAAFCAQCGAALTVQNQQEVQQTDTAPIAAPRAQTYAPAYGQASQYGSPAQPMSPVTAALKRLGSSPLFLTAVICYTVSVFFSLIGAFAPNVMFGSLVGLFESAGIPTDAFYFINGFSAFFTFIAMIPAVLMAISMWLSYATCADRASSQIKTTGLTIIKVLNLISLVFFCIGDAIFLVVFLIGFITVGATVGNRNSSLYAENAAGISVGILTVLFIIAAITSVLTILYYAKLNKTLSNMKNAALYGQILGVASTYVAVMSILTAVVSFFSAFAVLFKGSFVTSLSGLASSVASVCFAIFIFKYNSTMNAFTMNAFATQNGMPTGNPNSYSYPMS